MSSQEIIGTFRFGVPCIEIELENIKIPALVDTGFNGGIMLPQQYIDQLQLKPLAISEYLTASGDKVVTQEYQGAIKWLDKQKQVSLLASPHEICLVGMEVLHGSRLVVERHKNLISISNTLDS